MLPEFFEIIFGQEFIVMLTATIATTKIFRNALGTIKGAPAVILTMVISIAVGEFTYLQLLGWAMAGFIGVIAGAVSAGLFKGTKLLGKLIKIDKQ